MKRRPVAILPVITLLVGLILAILPFSDTTLAQNPAEMIIEITSPADQQQLFGLVNIIGSAAHPTAFDTYTLEYKDLGNPNAPWLLVQPSVRQQVQNDVIGAWNTNMVPDGNYHLRLRILLTDGQIGEVIVSNLKVINSEPTPVPTTAASVPEATQSMPAPGPSPTSPIQQPPSNNPAPGNNSELDTTSDNTANAPNTLNADQPSGQETTVNFGRIRSAFCAGAYLTIGGFAVMLAYRLLHSRLRPYTQHLLWQQSQDDFDDD